MSDNDAEIVPLYSVNEEQLIDDILKDGKKKEELLKKLGAQDTSSRTPASGGGKEDGHLPLSGKNEGTWQMPAFAPFGWWPPGPTPFGHVQAAGGFPPFMAYPGYQPAPPEAPRGKRPRTEDSDTESSASEDHIDLLDDAEALEMIEFDPAVDPEDAWHAPKAMESFLDKHFNRSLSETERSAINKTFPKPSSKALAVPRLDEQVKDHLKGKGKDPHYGSEKSLYRIQEAVLEVAGPLTCLWRDLMDKDTPLTMEDTLLSIQRALVLLGTASHSISHERRKVAWGKINPKLKSLASEDYSKREADLFGPGFLEKASKIEMEKTISKVSNTQSSSSSSKRPRYYRDKTDLRSFLSKGAPARYGGRNFQRRQPYVPPARFQSARYFRQPKAGHHNQSKFSKRQDQSP